MNGDASAPRPSSLEDKLRSILEKQGQYGREVCSSARHLADKLAGSAPSSIDKNPEQERPARDMHGLVDALGDLLGRQHQDINGSLERAHRAVGDFGERAASDVGARRLGTM
jgi:hypothetical protein